MRRVILDANPLRQQLSMVCRIPKKQLAGLGALEVQMGIVIPGEADATVDLNVLGSRKEVCVGACRLREARGDRNFVRILRGGKRGILRSRSRRLHLEQHVGTAMLDCLEATDRSTKLVAEFGI